MKKINKTNILLVASFLVFVLSGLPTGQAGWSAYAHGTDTGMSGSMGMMKTMDLMHEQMDGNQLFDCDKATDMEMMEEGEEMMDEMMGHEDHERVEEAMEKDMQDHDAMHMMMGMWSSGCIGDETMNTLAVRYGYDRMNGFGMMQGYGMGGGFVTTFLVWGVLILAIVGLWRWIKMSKSGASTV